jgi:hypothetical protein
VTDDHPEDLARRRAERHANADLRNTLAHGVCHHTVHAGHRQQQCHRCEHGEQKRPEAGRGRGGCERPLHRIDFDGDVSVAVADQPGQRAAERERIHTVRSRDDVEHRRRTGMLISGRVNLGLDGPRGSTRPHVADHADDAHVVGRIETPHNPMADRIPIGKCRANERLVDDSDERCVEDIGVGEVASTYDRNPHRAKVIGRHDVEDCLR